MRTFFIEDRTKIDEIIKSCKVCYVAMSANDIPYVLPMNFALDGDVVILHSAQSGRMWNLMKTNPRVCVNWTKGEELAWQNERVGCSYRMVSSSVLAEGKVEFITDFSEKENCLHKIMAQYSDSKFKFNTPSVKNVGIIKIHMKTITAKEFGVKTVMRKKF